MIQVGKFKNVEPLFEPGLDRPWFVRCELWEFDVMKFQAIGELQVLARIPERESAVKLWALSEEDEIEDRDAHALGQKVVLVSRLQLVAVETCRVVEGERLM